MNQDLEVIGHIHVPHMVYEHRFYREAMAVVRNSQRKVNAHETKEKVIGTANTRMPELYGWAKHVEAHRDETGIIYFVALNPGKSLVVTVSEAIGETSIVLNLGDVVRMDDHARHFTHDDKARICSFIGSYHSFHDYEALTKLQQSVDALAAGDYYGAPRVSRGFRVLLRDECYVLDDNDDLQVMLHKDAVKKEMIVATCNECDRPAARLDNKWPWFNDYNRCHQHIGKPE
jgi:hypothetical protein